MDRAVSTLAIENPTGDRIPAVTVVVPCYKRGDLLAECLGSLRTQDFQDWEAIVIDDGTPSTEVKDAVMDQADPRIRYIHRPTNSGLAVARNIGYGLANAVLVLPVDSDDRLHPAFLTKTVWALVEDPAADCVFTDFQLFGDSEVVSRNRVGSLEDMLRSQWIPGPGTLQRRAIWERVGGYCELPAMTAECEWDFWMSACERGLKAVHIPEPLYLYRRHADTLSATAQLREFELRELLYKRHKPTFDAFDLGSGFRTAGYLRSATACLRSRYRLRALRLTLRGLRLDPSNGQLWRQLAIAMLPVSLVKRVRERRLAKATQMKKEQLRADS